MLNFRSPAPQKIIPKLIRGSNAAFFLLFKKPPVLAYAGTAYSQGLSKVLIYFMGVYTGPGGAIFVKTLMKAL
jgi:hypothetical protein